MPRQNAFPASEDRKLAAVDCRTASAAAAPASGVILLPVQGGFKDECAIRTFAVLCRNSAHQGPRLRLVHVVTVPMTLPLDADLPDVDSMSARIPRHAEFARQHGRSAIGDGNRPGPRSGGRLERRRSTPRGSGDGCLSARSRTMGRVSPSQSHGARAHEGSPLSRVGVPPTPVCRTRCTCPRARGGSLRAMSEMARASSERARDCSWMNTPQGIVGPTHTRRHGPRLPGCSGYGTGCLSRASSWRSAKLDTVLPASPRVPMSKKYSGSVHGPRRRQLRGVRPDGTTTNASACVDEEAPFL